MNWKLKARILRVLELIPAGSSLHYQLQRHVTKEWPRRHEVLDQLLTAARRVVAAAQAADVRDLGSAHFLEIGAGRDLAFAIALRLLGVARITCVDVSRLGKLDLVAAAGAYLTAILDKPYPDLTTWHAVERFGIRYVAPAYLETAGLAHSSFDVFCSVDTLEHIPPAELAAVLAQGMGVLKPEGVMVHLVDYGDHFARSDNGLSRFNFLTYSELEWRPFNSRFQHVNRLRHSQYLRLFGDAGMRILNAEADVDSPQPAILENLAPEFAQLDVDDLFTVRALIVSRP